MFFGAFGSDCTHAAFVESTVAIVSASKKIRRAESFRGFYQKKTLQLLPPFVQMSVIVLYCYNTILSAIYGIGIVIMFHLYVMYINDVYMLYQIPNCILGQLWHWPPKL